jgi:hypothetical protein
VHKKDGFGAHRVYDSELDVFVGRVCTGVIDANELAGKLEMALNCAENGNVEASIAGVFLTARGWAYLDGIRDGATAR